MKKNKYFGTDGIRGIVGQDFDAELAIRIAHATATYIKRRPAKVVIGWDTRASCDFIVHIFAGILSYYGIDVVKVGVVPTAALSFLTNKLKADLGVMVSASHCSAKYNGVKFFTPRGEKLSDDENYEFDKLIVKNTRAEGEYVGTITENLKAIKIWQRYLVRKFKPLLDLKLKIAVDGAFGSGAKCAREVFETLGIHADFLNDKSTGFNINDGCGATKPSYMSAVMSNGDFDLGFAFDGDADRCIVFDEKGNHIHGDIIIFLLAKYFKDQGKLAKNKTVATILFNLGVEKALNAQGIKLVRTNVGDAPVYHALKKEGLTLGGETCGHIIFPHIWRGGDGLVLALMVLAVLNGKGKFSELSNEVSVYPQININTEANPAQKRKLFTDKDFNTFVKSSQSKYKDFRIIVRPSGTESIVRVTVEGAEKNKCEQIAIEIVAKIRKVLKSI